MAQKFTLENILSRFEPAIIKSHGKSVWNAVKQCIDDEDMDGEFIVEDLSDDIDSSTIIENVTDNCDLSDDSKEELFKELKNSLDASFKNINPYELTTQNMKLEMNNAKKYLQKNFASFYFTKSNALNNIAYIRAVGRKAEIPNLLQWCIDVYSKRKFELFGKYCKEYKLMNIGNDIPNFKDPSWNQWANDVKFFRENSVGKMAIDWLQYYFSPKGVFSQTHLNQIQLIGDNIRTYIHYYCAMNRCINKIMKKYKIYPFQIDFWIIPTHATLCIIKDDNDSDEDFGDYEQNENIHNEYEKINKRKNEYFQRIHDTFENRKIHNTETRLLSVGVPYVKEIFGEETTRNLNENDIEKLSDIMLKMFDNLFKKQKIKNPIGYSRYMCVLDRRVRGYNTIFSDTLLIYKPMNGFGKIRKKYDEFDCLHNSKIFVLPKPIATQQDRHTGSGQSLDGHMFMLGWHIHSSELIRCYWHHDGSLMRFFENYIYDVWPAYFKLTEDLLLRGKKHKQIDYINKDLITKLWKYPLKDYSFECFYKIIMTNDKIITSVPSETEFDLTEDPQIIE